VAEEIIWHNRDIIKGAYEKPFFFPVILSGSASLKKLLLLSNCWHNFIFLNNIHPEKWLEHPINSPYSGKS
jgi:hypothetical protein